MADKDTTPDRIWAAPEYLNGYSQLPFWDAGTFCTVNDGGVEYVRKDLTGWRPIETAPKDNSRILLYCEAYGPSTGYWYVFEEKWVAAAWLYQDEATHWQPLPTPPRKGE